MPNKNILTVSHLTKSFGDHTVLSDLTFALQTGHRLAIIAPSGSGKTTLLHILAKLQTPDSGTFVVNAQRPAVIFQEPRLFPHLTIEQNIFLPLHVQRTPITALIQQQLRQWLDVCELAKFRNNYPHELSGGMMQKVALIRGLLPKPTLAFLDEPFQSIGQPAKKRVIQYLLAENPSLSALLVTHDPEEVSLMATSTLFFKTNQLGKYILLDTDPVISAPTSAETHFMDPRRSYV